MSLRLRRRLRILCGRGPRILRRHAVSVVSVCVLAGAAYVASTNGGFESPRGAVGESPQSNTAVSEAQAIVTPTSTSIRITPRPRSKAIVYVVSTQEEGLEVLATHNRLVWDTLAGDTPTHLPDIRILVAGTPEEQSQAIQTLNSYVEVGPLLRIDFQVIDLRPGREFAANTGTP